MVHECKQSATTSSSHVRRSVQVNTFHRGLKPWMDLYGQCVCPGSYLKYAFLIYKAKLWQSNRGIPWPSWCYLICIITRGLCSFIACWWPFCHAITSTKCPRALGTLTRPWNVYPSNSAFFNYFLSNHCCSLATIMSYQRMNEKLSNDVGC